MDYKDEQKAVATGVTNGVVKQQEYERGFIDGMQEQMRRSVDKAVNAMAGATRNDVLEEVAQEFDRMVALGDTAASFAAFVRRMKT